MEEVIMQNACDLGTGLQSRKNPTGILVIGLHNVFGGWNVFKQVRALNPFLTPDNSDQLLRHNRHYKGWKRPPARPEWSIRVTWHVRVRCALDLQITYNSLTPTRYITKQDSFFMTSEETPLLSTTSDRNHVVYLRFSPARKKIILVTVSACGLINCMYVHWSNSIQLFS